MTPIPLNYALVSVAARLCGVRLNSLIAGVEAGEVAHRTLLGGTRVVRLTDVRRWQAGRSKGGRPRKAKA